MTDTSAPTAMLTCMDARLDARGILDAFGQRPAFVLRNAGGRATDDAVRSLVVTCQQGVKRVLVVHHTRCAMASLTQQELHASLPDGTAEIDFLTIDDPEQTLRSDVEWLKQHPLLPVDLEIFGYSFDLDTGTSRLVHALSAGSGDVTTAT